MNDTARRYIDLAARNADYRDSYGLQRHNYERATVFALLAIAEALLTTEGVRDDPHNE